MREFVVCNGLAIKSDNTKNKIMNRFVFSLLVFLLLSIITSFITNNSFIDKIYPILGIILTLGICFIVEYIFMLMRKEYNIKRICDNNILLVGLILSLFTCNSSFFIIIIASLITSISKNLIKYLDIKSSLLGIIIVILFGNISLDSYNSILLLMGNYKIYMSIILSIISYIYLFYNKSIKYLIPLTSIGIYFIIMLLVTLFSGNNLYDIFFLVIRSNIVFLSVFVASDFVNTPISKEGEIIYGILLGLLTSIISIFNVELSMVIGIIIVTLFTNIIDMYSFKLRYNKKFYNILLSIFLVLILIDIPILIHIMK